MDHLERRPPTAEEFCRWQDGLGLSAAQVGYLARVLVVKGVGSARARKGEGRRADQCNAVQKWRAGDRPISANTWELLQAKGLLLRLKLATFDELVTMPLHTLMERIHK